MSLLILVHGETFEEIEKNALEALAEAKSLRAKYGEEEANMIATFFGIAAPDEFEFEFTSHRFLADFLGCRKDN